MEMDLRGGDGVALEKYRNGRNEKNGSESAMVSTAEESQSDDTEKSSKEVDLRRWEWNAPKRNSSALSR